MSGADDAVRRACELHAAGRPAEAIAACRRVLQRQPTHFEANRQLAIMLCLDGQADQAVFFARKAVQLNPNADAHATLGSVLFRVGRDAEAAAPLEEAVRADPNQATAWGDLALLCMGRRDYDRALDAAERAAALSPGVAQRINLATVRLEIGDAAGALALLRTARRDAPTDLFVAQSLASASLYPDGLSPEEVFEVHAALRRMLGAAETMRPGAAPVNGRPLRVGLVSPDLYDHSVAFFLEPVLAEHDRTVWAAVAVQTGRKTDATTARLRAYADEWIDASAASDDALTSTLRGAHLDVAVDLAGLTSGSRPRVFARRVAPVQVTAIGYPHTTGVPAMDFRLVDAVTDPEGSERFATEALVRLPGCFLCYRPPSDAPAVTSRNPGSAVTFGSFNSIKKVSEATLRLWGRVLREISGSRLILKGGAFTSRGARDRVLAGLGASGVSPDRVELRSYSTDKAGHLGAYHEIDVALDTFPYNGTTTTCEALWMGVPVVTRAGVMHASRVGASLLAAAGLPDLVAEGDDGFVRIAADLARDESRRRSLRAGLRDRVAASRLCDARAHAASWLEALRRMTGGTSRTP